MGKIAVFPEEPDHFEKDLDVVICFIEQRKRFLMLRKTTEGVWTAPGGKVERGESIEHALTREIEEETGLTLLNAQKLGCLYFDNNTLHFPMHIYYTTIEEAKVTLSREHDRYDWYTIDEIYSLEKHPGAAQVIDFFQQLME